MAPTEPRRLAVETTYGIVRAMSKIKIGDAIPSATLRRLTENGPEEIDSAAYCKGRKVILFGLPGAYTGTCHNDHMPSFLNNIDAIKAKGIDEVICVPVNDMFVLKAWGESLQAAGKVTLLSDGNAAFANSMEMSFDGSGFGLGTRSLRYAMVVDDGVVQSLQVEESPGTCSVTSGLSILETL